MSTTPTTCPHCGIPDKTECVSWQGSRRSICFERQIASLKAELEQAKADRARAAMEERNRCLATMERQIRTMKNAFAHIQNGDLANARLAITSALEAQP